MIQDKLLGGDLEQDMTLCLTFDDGLGEHSADLAQFLFDEDVEATFFLRGCRADKDHTLIEQHVKLGHVVANHTWKHKHLDLITADPDEVRSQVELLDTLITPYVTASSGIFFFRAPYGGMGEIRGHDSIVLDDCTRFAPFFLR